jgi:asparagine synthase (glutamine-hydrolysing)
MCGLAGFTKEIREKERGALLRSMISSIRHRGPDEEGYYEDEDISIGACRLSIIDIEGGHQPMTNEDGSIRLAYNGEIYNFKELREDLSRNGHIFRTRSDTEVIVHAYEEYGYGCLEKLRGMFAFALWDKRKQLLFMARDRFGIKPIYYARLKEGLIFASEMKCLLQAKGLSREIDLEAIDQYLSFLWIPDPKTPFSAIRKLPGGHYLVYRNGEISIREYWDLRFAAEERSEKDWIEAIRSKLEETVKLHLESDVPIGVFLSGGVDSSAVLAYAAKFTTGKTRVYTTAFRREDIKKTDAEDDLKYAKLVAGVFNTEHDIITLTPDITKLLSKTVYHMDEPVADPAAIATYLICEATGGRLKVLLSGMGGDEIFAGYPWDLGAKFLEMYKRFPLSIGRIIPSCLSRLLPGGADYPLTRRLKKFAAAAGSEDGMLLFKTYFTKADKETLYAKDVKARLEGFSPYRKHAEYLKRTKDMDLLARMLYLDIKTFLPCLNLAYTDKMAMANSVEVRVPFLDHEFAELACAIPSGLKIRRLQQKYIYKRSLEGVLPEAILKRKKTGFGAPVGAWLDELRPLIDELLSEEAVKRRGYFNYETVRSITDGENCDWMRVWQLLILEIWHRVFIDSFAAGRGSGFTSAIPGKAVRDA